MLRIVKAAPLAAFRVKLELTDGTITERDLLPYLRGPIFEAIRNNPDEFNRVEVESGGLAWPNGADLCPDTVIHGGLPAL